MRTAGRSSPGGPVEPATGAGELVENAVNFTNNGDRITLSVEVDVPHVALEVRDTGPGIPQRDIPLIFERFYKADRRRQDSGAGLAGDSQAHRYGPRGRRAGGESRGRGQRFPRAYSLGRNNMTLTAV